MASVIRVENLDYRTTTGDLRRIFRENGTRPEDIHLGAQSNGKCNGTAFLVFLDRKEAESSLRVDGAQLKDSRLSVRSSNPKEFDRMFPGVAMMAKAKQFTREERITRDDRVTRDNRITRDDRINRDDRITSVVKVENIDFGATPSDIRRFYKEHGARPEDIHLVVNNGKHNGCAFLIFNSGDDAAGALKLDGITFRGKRLSVKASSPKEFDRFFPRVPMISKLSNRGRGGGRGRGINRGGITSNSGNTSRPVSHADRSQDDHSHGERFSNGSAPARGRGGGMRGGMRGGGMRGGAMRGGRGGGPTHRTGGRVGEQFFGSSREQGNNGRARSRSPIASGRREVPREPPARKFNPEQTASRDNRRDFVDKRRPEPARNNPNSKPTTFSSNHNTRLEALPIPAVDDKKYLKIFGLSFNASQVDIQNFFRPILTRDIFIMRNSAGKFNGSAVVEFFSDGDARQAIKLNGKKCGHQSISVIRPGKDDIERSMQESKASNEPPAAVLPDFSAINAVAQNNPQVQHLLNLLTATVNTIAAGAAVATNPTSDNKGEYRNGRSDRNRADPVISRVATSANIDVGDIKRGRVVGLRNLPFTVTSDDILQFFHNFKVVADSVRIHYLEDGRCSGDAIICFRSNRDARNAVNDLNKGTIGRRKVELFFL